MTVSEAAGRDPIEQARALLAAKPDGLIEAVAREAGVSTQAALELLPPEQRLFVAPERFEDVWKELATWGTVLFLMHTPDVVLECEGALPVGSFGHGYYNIHGDSPIGGHIKAANCRAIYLVDRTTAQGRRACSVQFFNESGEVMFKIFVRRDDSRALLPDQLKRFEALKTLFV
ncbi:heme utilization cystosolic carrier protein HutX [Bosea sp. (in: a-proteobacteria)]|uniref:heme utilization cystosolic carrier protein HutX n=1 Tax=Bosea sp. (in: a-proteobacteria) TaxID=1871050 RepID=UPI001AD38654|nr:heme utilization cystosolic carrier protein HutX [Bosea sp. (in: a-proteobacteria)]MBN9445155.1 heme utilization cystosolic carrier protein HutX [Bosea sp. (in: a-proteobacteria)]